MGHDFANEYCTRCDQYEHCGDINGDGVLNSIDSNLLKRALSAQLVFDDDSMAAKAADINGDGVLNSIDANLLKRMLAGA